jgi:hypothetical protein
MTKIKEYIFLVVIIVGLSLYLFLHQSNQANYQLPQLAAVEKKTVTKIEVIQGGNTLTIQRDADTWLLAPQGYPVDLSRAGKMLDTVASLTVTDLVSESEDYLRYDLTDEKQIKVRAYAGEDVLREFSVGKTAPSLHHTYIMLGNDPKVYHARENFRNHYDVTLDSLRDKTGLSFDKTEIDELAIVKNDVEIKLILQVAKNSEATGKGKEVGEKASETSASAAKWHSTDGELMDTAKIENLLNTLSNLKCKTYIEDKKKEDLAEPIYEIRLKGAMEYSLLIFPKSQAESDDYPTISSYNKYPFLLSASQAETIMNMFNPPKTDAN